MTVPSPTDLATSSSRRRRLRATATKKRLWLEQHSQKPSDGIIMEKLDYLLQSSMQISSALHMSSVYVPIYVPYFACTSTESLYDATPAAQTDSGNTTIDTGEYIPKICGSADNLQLADGVDEDSNGHVDTNLGAEAIATTSEHDGCESDVDCASEPSSNPFTNLPPEALTAFHRAPLG